MKVVTLGYAWLDTGTVDSVNEATEVVKVSETRRCIKIMAFEEITYQNEWTNEAQLRAATETYGKSPYGAYLKRVADGKIQY